MRTAHELYVAVRSARRRAPDLSLRPGSADVELFMSRQTARAWADRLKERAPGVVLELHLDRLFQIVRDDDRESERRFEFHESEMQEHAVQAARYQDGAASKLIDADDLRRLREAATKWLKSPAPADPANDGWVGELAIVLMYLLRDGKLG